MTKEQDQPAVVIKKLSKSFKVPLDKSSGIKQHVVNFFQRKKGYREFKAIDDISFEVEKGEFFGIVGRNGSGKSTLLKTLSGIYAPDHGLVHVNGSLATFIELGVGFTPELTGRENVFLNGALLGFSKQEMEAMYDEIVDFAELHDFMEERLKNYSSGMQVRLAFSVAIRAKSDVLVLDEVLAVGDANFQKKCYNYFRQLKSGKKTVILVSHDMEAVKKFSDRALLLEEGKIVSIGNSEEVSDEYTKRNMEKNRQRSGSTSTAATEDAPVQIKQARLLDVNNKEIKDFKTGDPLKIAIKYEAREKVKEINIGVGLRSDAHGYIFGYNTQMDKFAVDKDAGELILQFDSLPILQGSYTINVVCFGEDETVPYDLKPGVISFYATSFGREQSYRGAVSLGHQWRL